MNETLIWLPVSAIAREYQKSPQMIRNWVKSGFILEIGYVVKRDVTGHFIIGVPASLFANFANNQSRPVVNQTQSI
jgi:hypothetical protein